MVFLLFLNFPEAVKHHVPWLYLKLLCVFVFFPDNITYHGALP